MTAPVQYLLDGTDLAAGRTLLTADSDLSLVGDDDAFPGAVGETFARRGVGAGQLQLGYLIEGTSVADWQDKWRTFKALIWRPDTARTLVRRELLPGDVVVESAAAVTANALPTASMQGDRACLTVADFKVVDGYFHDTTAVTVAAPASVTVAGDARTSRMTITMTAGTVTNTTTGATLSYSGAGTVTIDVQGWTATSSGAPVAGQLSWPADGHDYWFDLDPGVNVLTGTASITYRPAWLP